jgi:tetratricopeptide (TPR) repeat protein
MVRATFLLALLVATVHARAADRPDNFQQIAKQADRARSAGHFREALDLYRQAVGLRPSWTDGWWALGTTLYEQDRFPEAIAAFRHFIALVARGGPAHAFLGLCEYETGDYDSALRDFQAWSRQGFPGPADLKDVAVFHWALLLTSKGKFVESLYLLATEAGKKRDNPGLAEAMGLASLHIGKLPQDYPAEQREMVWLAGKAALYASLPAHEFERADEYADRLLAHYPSSPNVHYFRGVLYRFENDDIAAKRQFQTELAISPRHAPALVELAQLDLAAAEFGQALTEARSAASIEPTSAEAHHMLGRILLATDQLQEGTQELEQAKRLAPDSAIIRSHLAMAYRRLGKTEEAKKEAAAFLVLKDREGSFGQPPDKSDLAQKPGRQAQ